METINAYYKNEDGTLKQIAVVKIDNELFSALGTPLHTTGEHVELFGWPDDKAEICTTELGDIFYIASKEVGNESMG